MNQDNARTIFKRGSKTYFGASRFFPAAMRADVTTLYAFVRIADDYVDAVPQNAKAFFAFREKWERTLATGARSNDPIIDEFYDLARRKNLDPLWIGDFLNAMQADLSVHEYDTIEDMLVYIHGSAEVVGLCMARLMDLPEAAEAQAAMLGRAMQYVNFIRDFAEDVSLGRRYLPLEGADPRVTDIPWARRHAEQFARFIRGHLDRYSGWAAQGRAGFSYIARDLLVPIKTAQDMYDWTAARIRENPSIVLDGSLKPGKMRIMLQALRTMLTMRQGYALRA